jgi:hypothetical protein
MVGMLDLIIDFTGHTPANDIESLVYVIASCASYVIVLVTIPYLITVIGQIFSRR